jgi:hypothetical protein
MRESFILREIIVIASECNERGNPQNWIASLTLAMTSVLYIYPKMKL